MTAEVAAPHYDVDFLLFLGKLLHRERYRRVRELGDHVDALGVVPAARDGGGEIRLVLVVGGETNSIFWPSTSPPKSSIAIFAASTEYLPP